LSQKLIFTPEQEKAIHHNKGHLLIVACPGSGKTEIVSRRVAQLIKDGADPEKIVSFTFTEKAADELKTRIRRRLEVECPDRADFGDMYVGTIHSFCFHILKELEPKYRSYDVLDDAMRVAFVNKYENYYNKIELVRLQKANKLKHYTTIGKFLESADIVMTEDIDVSKLPKNKDNARFAKCFKAYRELLDEEKYFDFSSIIQTVVKLLQKNPSKLKKVQKLVKHLTVDEYQDVNQMQELLVELLSKGAESVCVVGDDDQNIYHWRGSNVDFIRKFESKYSKNYDVTKAKINTNYRSTPSIISTAREFIEHNNDRIPKDMVHNKKSLRKSEDGDMIYNRFDTEREEFDFIVNKIKELEGTEHIDKRNNPFSITLGDFAILVRTNSDAARIIRHLDRNGIDAISYSGSSIFESMEVQLAVDCIGYVFSCLGYTSNRPDLNDLKDRHEQVFNKTRFKKADSDLFVKKLKKLKERADKFLAKKPRDYLGGLGLQEFFHNILNAMGAEDFDFRTVYNYNLAVLSDAISDYENVYQRLRASQVEGFMYFVFAFAQSHYSETIHNDPTIQNAVNVLTIHKAKGMEYPVVFIPGFIKRGSWSRPTFVDQSAFNSDMYFGDTEDDRRTYYTAMTRAEKYLFITNPKIRISKTGRNMRKEAHPFINEIPTKHFSRKLYSKRKKSKLPPKQQPDGSFPTSFSHLNSYARCPKDFELRHMYGYNAGVPAGFGYGNNIHNMLNVIFNNYLEKKHVPTEKEVTEMFDRMFKLRYAPGKMADNMRKKAEQIIKNYVKISRKDFDRVLKTEKNFEFVMGDALIAGQIDLLMKVDENKNVTDVEIIDFKSEGKEDGEYKADHEKQLRYYAIACLDSLDLHPKRAWVHHLSEKDPKKSKSQVDISEKHLDKTRKEIKTQVDKILSREYPAKPRKGKDTCKECDYKCICSEKGFKTGISFGN